MHIFKNLFGWYFKTNLLTRILAGLVLGVIFGVAFVVLDINSSGFIHFVQPFGDLFVRLLKMIVTPIILLSLIGGAASIAPSKLGKAGVKVLAFYLLTSAFAVILGLLLGAIFKPGFGLNIVASGVPGKPANPKPLVEVLLSIVPVNPFEAIVKGDVLPIIFFSVIFGVALSSLKEAGLKSAQLVLDCISGCCEAIFKIIGGIMQFAPIGVFALVSIVLLNNGPKVLGPLALVVFIVYLGYILHLFFIYGGFLFVNRLGFIKFLKKANEVMIMGLVTRSSGGTLPLTIQNSEEKMGVPRSLSSFALSLGATINMDGTAIYLGICTMFIGYATGNPLTFDQQLIVVITATLASIGTAGVPGAGGLMLLMVLESINMGVTEGSAIAVAYAMIFGIDSLLDMGRTCLNITGDMVCTILVAKGENDLDMSKWQ